MHWGWWGWGCLKTLGVPEDTRDGEWGKAGDTGDRELGVAGDTRMRNGGCLGTLGVAGDIEGWQGTLGWGTRGVRGHEGVAGDTKMGNWGWQGTLGMVGLGVFGDTESGR